MAVEFVSRLGYTCVARNYRCPLGEIDLIARDGSTLVFIEIKTRRNRPVSYAKESVNAGKRRRMSMVALAYMKSNGCGETKARFDVVAISLMGGVPKVELIRNAFDLAY